MAGIAPGRTAYGEQYHRAAITLAAMTGNIGVLGGSAAGKAWSIMNLLRVGPGLRVPPNPVDTETPPPRDKLPNRSSGYVYGHGVINVFRVADAVLKGKAGGYPADYKLIYLSNSNIVNQWPNSNKVAQALRKLEFVVVEEQFVTATARFADILLPTCTFLERNEVTTGAFPLFYGYRHKVVDPLGESKSPLQIANELAARLGLRDYNDKTEEDLLREVMQGSEVSDFESFKKRAVVKVFLPGPYIPLKREIEDPEKHPFRTPSGKIEIYSQLLANMQNSKLPPIPKYIEPWESLSDPLAARYPLQLITTHFKRRAHTQFDNLPWLRELERQAIKINPVDAEARGIKDGDLVMVFNDRGRMIISAKVTERIMPGVVDIPQGAWYNPDKDGTDRGGCANVLTRDEPSPGGALPSNTALVQVVKYQD